MKLDLNLPAVDLPPDLHDRLDERDSELVAECAAAPELEAVARRYGRILQPMATLSLGALLVIIALLILGGEAERWYLIGAGAALIVAFLITLYLYRRRMQRTFHALVRRRLADRQP